jgi:GNAT superfamily N-acetyltransferase
MWLETASSSGHPTRRPRRELSVRAGTSRLVTGEHDPSAELGLTEAPSVGEALTACIPIAATNSANECLFGPKWRARGTAQARTEPSTRSAGRQTEGCTLQELPENSWPPIFVFRLSADDWPTLKALRLQALTESPKSFLGEVSAEQKYDAEYWRRQLRHHVWLLATIDTKPVGIVKFNHRDGTHLEALWVAEAVRRQKVGETLVAATENVAAAMGMHELRLWVFTENHEAHDFYLRLGYTKTGDPQHLESAGRDEQEYRKPLESLAVAPGQLRTESSGPLVRR